MTTPQDDAFAEIVQSLDFEVPAEVEERFNLLDKETETGIIDSAEHFMIIIMDQDEESELHKWRFIAKTDPETVKMLLAKLLKDWN